MIGTFSSPEVKGTYVRSLLILLGLVYVLWLASPCPAQPAPANPNIKFDDNIEVNVVKPRTRFSELEAPEGSSTMAEYESWIEVKAKFTTLRDITEEVTVKAYVEAYDALTMEDKGQVAAGTLDYNNPKLVILTGETTLLNVPKGKDHQVVFYIHPVAVKRYGGKNAKDLTSTANNIRFEAVEKNRGGAAEPINRKKDYDPNWVTLGTQVPGVLLPVTQTPWWPFDALRYNQLKTQ